ncbi:MAG: phospholipase D-like domain-containing protein [Chitinophagaceae bacterium]
MRFKSTPVNGFTIFAVTGTNTVAFAIDCPENSMQNLLGFTAEKEYMKSNGQHVRVTVMGFKVFKERIENPVAGALYSTYDNPIQSFTWEDFSSYPDNDYTYHFTPLYNDPTNITRGQTISVNVHTEQDWKADDHSIFFNRGVASSQAYAMKFGNENPDNREGAYEWLSRGLKEAIIAFIKKAQNGDTLYGCFYEFRNDEILTALKEAAENGANLHIIYDAKDNEHTDPDTGKLIDSFPKVENEEAIIRVGLDQLANVELIPRDRNKSYLSHNKFMILEKAGQLQSIWTGSTNISKGGIFGQANVGHSVEDPQVAAQYKSYWDLLKAQPASGNLKAGNEQIQNNLVDVNNIPQGITCIFSPRRNIDMLKFYADLLDSAQSCCCITLAFNVHEFFQTALSDNTTAGPLTFLLLEKDDTSISDYVYKNNVVKAVGSYIGENQLYKWVRETSTNSLQLNTHVMFIHTKFLLKDPLSADPIVVTGSANFSKSSTDTNDENMLIIRGSKRVADIYFTEFLRLFNHYYFRWIVRRLSENGTLDPDNPAFLVSTDKWTDQYKAGKYKRKRVEIFVNMDSPQHG